MPSKLKYEYIQGIFADRGYTLVSPPDNYNSRQLEYICPRGHRHHIALYHFRNGHGCKWCAVEDAAERQRYPYEYVKSVIATRGCKLLANDYVNNSQPLQIVCECGSVYITTFDRFTKGASCRECKNKKISVATRGQHRPTMLGENNPAYNPKLTDSDRVMRRKIPEYKTWHRMVKERDNYTCRKCGKYGNGEMHSHHLDNYKDFPNKRLDVENGATLCKECHRDFHSVYGQYNNTKEQFEKWVKEGIE